MKFLAILVIVLAYGPAIFDLAVTGRGVNRPTRTSTTDPALSHFYTLNMGKPSLAIPPTGLVGVLTESSGHNNQDSAVPIWTIYRITTHRALANIGTCVASFNRRRLDRQWHYIHGWWRSNSARVIEEALIVSFYSLLFLAVILTIWRKQVLCQRWLEVKPAATLAQPSPSLANSIAVESRVRNEIIQTTQRSAHSSSYTQTPNNIVVIGGTSTPSPYLLTRHLAFNFQSCVLASTPVQSFARSTPRLILEASTDYTIDFGRALTPLLHHLARGLSFDSRNCVRVSAPTDCLAKSVRQELFGASTTYTGTVSAYEELSSGLEDSKPRRIVVITLLALLGGLVIIRYEEVDRIALWTVTIILVSAGAGSSSAVSRQAENIYRLIPKRTVTFRLMVSLRPASLSLISLPPAYQVPESSSVQAVWYCLGPSCRLEPFVGGGDHYPHTSGSSTQMSPRSGNQHLFPHSSPPSTR